MGVNYKKLEHDLLGARDVADAVPYDGDVGSCNKDAVRLRLPRARESCVHDVLRGCGFSYWKHPTTPGLYVISAPSKGQGMHNTQVQEAVCAYLKAAGWDVFMWWQAD